MTLYLKYRPQLIDELDLESVRTQLKNIIVSGNIPHAFLFSGPKGTGKTSSARILAKVINCESVKDGEPCNICESCLSITSGNNVDILELDAASNRGIDDIRSLKEGIYLSPVSSKKKIYIIDEAHMLTIEAANAFLKTLEEPPAHVVFILATTNPEKLPATVISRLTQINFTKATKEDISRQLKRVAKGEGLKIEEKAIEKISKLADGSFRDAVKILENLTFKTKDIKESDVIESSHDVSSFFEILKTKDIKRALEFIENLVTKGVSIKIFTDTICSQIHLSLLAKNNLGEDLLKNFTLDDLITLNTLITESKNLKSPISQLPLEIAIIKFINPNPTIIRKAATNQGNTEVAEIKVSVEEKMIEEKPQEKSIEKTVEKSKEDVQPQPKKITLSGKNINPDDWQKLLENTRTKNFGIEALLRAAKPLDFNGELLVLGIYYKFHKEKLEDFKNTKMIEELCKETFGTDSIKIEYELIDKPIEKRVVAKDQSLTSPKDKDIIDAAKEIFG